MSDLQTLDRCNARLARAIFDSVPLANWQRARMTARYSPAGLGAFEFQYTSPDGVEHDDLSPDGPGIGTLWQLTGEQRTLCKALNQPIWYKINVTVERSGKFSVDFEYKDDYKEGDIMQRG